MTPLRRFFPFHLQRQSLHDPGYIVHTFGTDHPHPHPLIEATHTRTLTSFLRWYHHLLIGRSPLAYASYPHNHNHTAEGSLLQNSQRGPIGPLNTKRKEHMHVQLSLIHIYVLLKRIRLYYFIFTTSLYYFILLQTRKPII